MRNRYIASILLTAGILGATSAARAQQPATQPSVVTTTVDFAPVPPKLSEPKAKPAPKVEAVEEPDTAGGSARAGYFPLYNLNADVRYRAYDSDMAKVDVGAWFNGKSYKAYDQRVTSNNIGVRAGGNFDFGSDIKAKAETHYFHTALTTPQLAPGRVSNNINAAEVKLSATHGTDLHASVDYSYFGYISGVDGLAAPSDNRLRIAAGARYSLFGLDADFDLLGTHGQHWNTVTEEFTSARRTLAILGLTPAVFFDYEQIKTKVGLRLDLGFNTSDKFLNLAPDVEVKYDSEDIFELYARIDGGSRFHTLEDRYNYSIYVPAIAASRCYSTPVDARLGGTVKPLDDDLEISAFAGYADSRKMPMLAAVTDNGVLRSTFVPTSLTGWYAGLDAAYRYDELIETKANMRFYQGGYSKGYFESTDRARYVLGLDALVHATDELSIGLSYDLRAGRRYYLLSAGSAPLAVSMGTDSRIGARASYRLMDNLSVFARVDNIRFSSRPWVLPGVGAQGFTGLVGAEITF